MSSPPSNPFKLLRAYTEQESERLFGRDKDLVLMKDRVFSARTTLLFAGSGVGKTSFLRAKLIPTLRRHYVVAYHNAWASEEPLAAVAKTVRAELGGSPASGSLPALLASFRDAAREGTEDVLAAGAPRAKRFILVLDQFEEVFQYHSYEPHFKAFLADLCGIVNDRDVDARIVFSMREEYLGELSVFDNLIPDLFNNYYRLKYPSTREAAEIIERTAALAGATTHPGHLDLLVQDLSRIEKGTASATERASAPLGEEAKVVERDFVVPPYLQIACHRLWEAQATGPTSGSGFVFLDRYEPGEARRLLEAYFNKQLSSLTAAQQKLAAHAFDFLVTRQGAKIAYELGRLSEHMHVDKQRLHETLRELSNEERRILRETRAPDGSEWFELYHDLYGPVVDAWKRDFKRRMDTRVRRGVQAAIAMVAVLLVVGAVRDLVIKPRAHVATIQSADLRDPARYIEARAAYESLRSTLGHAGRADRFWAEAWDRRARHAGRMENAADALLSRLKALILQPTGARAEYHRREAARLIAESHAGLIATYHAGASGPIAAGMTADGQFVWTVTSAGVVRVWRADSREPKSEVLNLGNLEFPGEAGSKRLSQTRPAPASQEQAQPLPRVRDVAVHAEIGGVLAVEHAGALWIVRGTYEVPERVMLLPPVADGRRYSLNHVALSARGDFLAVGGPTGGVWRITTTDFEQGRSLAGVTAFAFTPDGAQLLTVDGDGSVRLADVAATAPPPPRGRLARPVTSVAFVPDGRSFLTRDSGRYQLWDTESVRPVGKPIDPGGDVTLSPDGRILASVSLSTRTRVFTETWNIESGERLGRENLPSGAGRVDAFRANGPVILTTSGGTARLWAVPSPSPQSRRLPLETFNAAVLDAAGERLLTLSGAEAQLWRIDGFRSIRSMANATALSLDGRFVAVSRGSETDVVDAATGRLAVRLPVDKADDLRVSPDRRFIAVVKGETLTLWDAQRPLGTLIPPATASYFNYHFVFSEDSRYFVAVAEADDSPSASRARVWELPSGRRVPLGDQATLGRPFALASTLLIIGGGKSAAVRDLSAGQRAVSLESTGRVRAVALNSSATLALTATDRKVALWDWRQSRMLRQAEVGGEIRELSFTPDGTGAVVVTSGWAHLFSLRDPVLAYVGSRPMDGDTVRVIAGQPVRVRAVANREVVEANFDPTFPEMLPGDPAAALREWERKLAQRVDDASGLLVTVGLDGKDGALDPRSGDAAGSPYEPNVAMPEDPPGGV